MSQFQKIGRGQISSHCVVHEDMGFVLHLRVKSLDKYIGNLITVQSLVKTDMFTAQLAFAGLYDKTVDVFLQQLFQTARLSLTAVPCIFQDNAVAVFSQHPVHSLDQPGKDVVRYVGCHYGDVPGYFSVAHLF